jgi:hypothetical protein
MPTSETSRCRFLVFASWRPHFPATLSDWTRRATYLLTELSPSWEAANCAATQKLPQHFMEPEGSLPCSQAPFTCPYPEPDRSHPISPRSILILSTNLLLGLPSGVFPSGFPTNIEGPLSVLSCLPCACPARSISLLACQSEQFSRYTWFLLCSSVVPRFVVFGWFLSCFLREMLILFLCNWINNFVIVLTSFLSQCGPFVSWFILVFLRVLSLKGEEGQLLNLWWYVTVYGVILMALVLLLLLCQTLAMCSVWCLFVFLRKDYDVWGFEFLVYWEAPFVLFSRYCAL